MGLYLKRVVVASGQDVLGILYRDGELDSGQLVVMHLNSRRELVDVERLPFNPRTSAGDIFTRALTRRTSALVLAHGRIDCLEGPNEIERAAALKMANAGMIIGIPVSDYLIVGYKTYYSFGEHRLIPPVDWDEEKRRPIWRSYAVSAIG